MDDGQAVIGRHQGPESTPESSHRSDLSRPIEVITRGERRRWSVEQKREIVAESLAPGVLASMVMRKHGISSGQLYTWRRQLASRVGGELAPPAGGFARVELAAGPRRQLARCDGAVPVGSPPRQAAGRGIIAAIEIVLRNGLVVRLDRDVDADALRRVLSVVEDR